MIIGKFEVDYEINMAISRLHYRIDGNLFLKSSKHGREVKAFIKTNDALLSLEVDKAKITFFDKSGRVIHET